jgi:cytoskeleton protein RodZ
VLSGIVGLVFVLLLVVLVWAFLPASEERQDPLAKQAISNPEQRIDGEPTMGGELRMNSGPTIAREPASDSEQSDDVSQSASLAPQEQNALEESNALVPVDQASVMEADLSALLDPTKEVATDSEAAQEPQVPHTTVSKTLVSESQDARGASLSASTDSESQPIEERGASPEQGLGAPRDSTFAAIDEGRAVDQAASRKFQLGQGSLRAARVSVERTPIDGGRLIEVDAGGPDRLSAAFSAACWVEVEDANQTLIYGDLSRAGDVLAIQGEAPMTVLLGNAPAVVMSFNQRRIDLSPETTRDLTARVVLEN